MAHYYEKLDRPFNVKMSGYEYLTEKEVKMCIYINFNVFITTSDLNTYFQC